MLPVEMLASIKDHIDAPDNFWSNELIWRRMHEAQQEVIRDISKEDPTFFVETFDLDFVASQATYDLPINAGLGTRIIFSENLTNTPGSSEISPAELRDLMAADSPSIVNLSSTYKFTLQGSKLRVLPTPSSAKTAAIRIWYVPTFGHMMQGTASGGSTTTITLPTAAANFTTNYGWKDPRNDFYNGMYVLIYEGTNIGETRKISDFTGGATMSLTVDTAFTAAIDTTSKYAIMCPVPETHHGAVCIRAALICAIKGRTRDKELAQAYYGHIGRPGALSELLSWVSKRQDARLETVRPIDIGE